MNELDEGDVKTLRAMTMEQRLKRGLDFMEHARQFKIASVRAHHPGWTHEKVMDEVRRWGPRWNETGRAIRAVAIAACGRYPATANCISPVRSTTFEASRISNPVMPPS